ncbi:metallophosphatase [Bifidobacterium ramosum]|uniref:Metallophosphatase n=1 Tax=Bifidobacterium ramosum TaxID=1798158 RepID=A0A6L4X0U8_9BIFI|nr:metallophosphatase [Bifidobacterium ramosum]
MRYDVGRHAQDARDTYDSNDVHGMRDANDVRDAYVVDDTYDPTKENAFGQHDPVRRRYGRHGRVSDAHIAAVSQHVAQWLAPAIVLLIALLVIGGWAIAYQLRSQYATGTNGTNAANQSSAALDKPGAVPQPVVEHHGNAPDCPDTDCISILVNGDLLFHEGLWSQYAVNPTATDGTAFDFTGLFEPMRKYIDASDIAICEFETPIAQRGGPYSAYPIFNIPPEVADAAAHVGYRACTHATNHSWDQGADGIARLWDTLAADGIAQTGSYKTEADSTKPLVIDSPTGGGKLGLVTGTVSLNGMTADHDWQVDRLREAGDPNHQADIDKAVAKAKAAREQGADVVAIAMHSVQEYLDYADSWQIDEAHALADTGEFDLIYGAGCHCAQPIEHYNGTWIIYGLGNAVTESANTPETIVNNQGVTARIQFAGRRGQAGTWRVNRIDWTPSANETRGKYQWCSLASDHPDGTCWNEAQDAAVRQRISDVIYSMGADRNVVREWDITAERDGK